jgi:hypothetical protein
VITGLEKEMDEDLENADDEEHMMSAQKSRPVDREGNFIDDTKSKRSSFRGSMISSKRNSF